MCDVTLSVYPHRAGLKNMPGHWGNRTYDLWNTSPMLSQLSYALRSVRVCGISAEHWASIPKVIGSNPTVARHIFQACPVRINIQSNITQASYSPEYITPTQQISCFLFLCDVPRILLAPSRTKLTILLSVGDGTPAIV